jgi:hypothetical protein
VLQALVRHEILESTSGSRRGYQLARQARRIDRKGRPLNFSVTGGQVHDSPSCESGRDIQITRRVWKRIFDALAAKSRNSLYLIDSTIVKAHRAAKAILFCRNTTYRLCPCRWSLGKLLISTL